VHETAPPAKRAVTVSQGAGTEKWEFRSTITTENV